MSIQAKEGRVTIFKNEYRTDDKQPEYRGGLMLDGKIYDMSLWVNQDRNGKKFFSGTIRQVDTMPNG